MRIAILAENSHLDFLKKKLSNDSIEIIVTDSFRSFCIVDAEYHFDGMFENDANRLKSLQQLSERSSVWVNAVAFSCSEIGNDLIRYNDWNTLFDQSGWEVVAVTEKTKESVRSLAQVLETEIHIIPDFVGMITPRVIAMLVNEAYYTYEMEVSTKEEIDIAMKLGTNYPYGPFEWSEKIGLSKIYDLLNNLASADDRYTISNKLKETVEGKIYKW